MWWLAIFSSSLVNVVPTARGIYFRRCILLSEKEPGPTFKIVRFTRTEGKMKCRPMHFIFFPVTQSRNSVFRDSFP